MKGVVAKDATETEAFLSGLCCMLQKACLPDSLPRNECKHLYIYVTIMKKCLTMSMVKDRHMLGDMRTHVKLNI